MHAHEKVQTLHQDVRLSNVVLYKSEEGERRHGYPIDWELGCEPSRVVPRDHALVVCLMFLAPNESSDPFKGHSRVYVHRCVA